MRTWKNAQNRKKKVTVYEEWIEVMGKYLYNGRVNR